MSKKLSYPKDKIDVLLLEGVHKDAVQLFEEEGYNVTYQTSSMSEDELNNALQDTQIIGIRSKTDMTEPIISKANKLLCIGAFCIGTNQIDLEAAGTNGVAVFNAPFSNTRSVVELVIAEMVLLIRNLPDKIMAMHEGRWEKSSENSHELRGKKLGIVGYGNIGSQLSVLAESMGLDVYYYDLEDKLPLGNATRTSSMKALFETVDIITLHIDGRPSNTELIGKKELDWISKETVFLNLSRGKVVNTTALKRAIDEGRILGAGIDVYPEEPKSNDEPFKD
jgi:D-3-phosphoglycerate dehydrogenase